MCEQPVDSYAISHGGSQILIEAASHWVLDLYLTSLPEYGTSSRIVKEKQLEFKKSQDSRLVVALVRAAG